MKLLAFQIVATIVVIYGSGFYAFMQGIDYQIERTCQSYFTGYAIQQCKERVRLGEPVFNEVRK